MVNSTIPGLAKVGRTTRPPAERAAELSAASGVATPFVLAFEQEFADCVWAERQVHGELDRLGLRVVPNREFFRGSPGDIIRIIQAHASHPGAPPATAEAQLSRVTLRIRLLAEAGRHLHGTGETLQDVTEAARLYEAAANAGSTVALERLAILCLKGAQTARGGRRRAMRLLKQGAAAGNYYCMAEMASLFAAEGHAANFRKAWDQLFERRAQVRCDEAETPGRFALACRSYIAGCFDLGLEPKHHRAMATEAKSITMGLVTAVESAGHDTDLRYRLAQMLRWSYEILLPLDEMPPAAAGKTASPQREQAPLPRRLIRPELAAQPFTASWKRRSRDPNLRAGEPRRAGCAFSMLQGGPAKTWTATTYWVPPRPGARPASLWPSPPWWTPGAVRPARAAAASPSPQPAAWRARSAAAASKAPSWRPPARPSTAAPRNCSNSA